MDFRKGMGVDFGDKQYGLQRGPKVAWSTGVEKVLGHVTSLQTGTKVHCKSVPKSHAVLRGLRDKSFTCKNFQKSSTFFATFCSHQNRCHDHANYLEQFLPNHIQILFVHKAGRLGGLVGILASF